MIARDRIEPWAYSALRAVAGFMFLFHGAQKLFGVLGAHAVPAVGTQMWFGGIIELACGTLIALGLFTRAAAFVCSGMLAVAYFQFHWKLALGTSILPIVNKGELAVLYCFVFLVIWLRGPGPFSLDRVLRRA